MEILLKFLKPLKKNEEHVYISYFDPFTSIFWVFLTFPCYKETNDVSL